VPETESPVPVAREENVAGGEPVVLGTRIRVAILYAMSEKAGMNEAEIAEEYPHVPVSVVRRVLKYALANRDAMVEYLRRDEE
jgi:uncharacterized protein (DUF433 family)